MSEKVKPRHFRCDCGDPAHSLYVDPDWWLDDDYPFPFLGLAVVSHPSPLFDRLKLAIKVVFNRPWSYMHEVYIHRDDVPEFVQYIMSLMPTTESTNDVPPG